MSEHGPGTQIYSSTMFPCGNSFIIFYGNRTKQLISEGPFEKHQWRHQVGELPKSGEMQALYSA